MVPLSEKEGPSSRGFAREGPTHQRELCETGLMWIIRHDHQDMFCVIPDRTQHVCNDAHWEKCVLAQARGPAVCQCVRAEGGLSQGIPQRTMGGLLGGKQVYLCLVESAKSAGPCGDLHSPWSVTCHKNESAARLRRPGM